ncbi:MAG TPA: hypothetical protein VHS35_24595, partial [Pseudonocardia sp.]|nr:hypothetical protein [Pseudonocardia sp.]
MIAAVGQPGHRLEQIIRRRLRLPVTEGEQQRLQGLQGRVEIAFDLDVRPAPRDSDDQAVDGGVRTRRLRGREIDEAADETAHPPVVQQRSRSTSRATSPISVAVASPRSKRRTA